MIKNKEHKPFVRISWNEAFQVMKDELLLRYGAKGKVTLKKDYGYEGVSDFYDEPTYVDIELREE